MLLCCWNSQCGSVLPQKGPMGSSRTAARAYSIQRFQVQNAFKSVIQKSVHIVQFLQHMLIHSWLSQLYPISRNHFLIMCLLHHKHTNNREYYQPKVTQVPLKIRFMLLVPLYTACKVFINHSVSFSLLYTIHGNCSWELSKTVCMRGIFQKGPHIKLEVYIPKLIWG